MPVSNYTELQAGVEDWIDRSDLTARLPEFVVLAEAQLNRALRHRKMLVRESAFTVDSQYESVPSNWLQTHQIVLNTSPITPLESLSKNQINDYRAAGNQSGKPRFFAMVGEEIEFYPTPDTSYTAELLYYRTIPPLASNDTNWLLTLSPDIYLHATILQAQLYVQDEEEAQKTSGLLGSLLESMNVANQRSQGDSSMRVRTQGFV